jgi:E3 ubiquitin-protein ligase BRE1
VTFSPSIQFKGIEDFQQHLQSKSKEIKSKLQTLFTNLANYSGQRNPDLQDLQGKLTKMLAAQKDYLVKVDRLQKEKSDLSELLEAATLRYIKAEKRLDRSKSSAVAKLERQAIAGTGNSAGSGIGAVEDVEMINGIEEETAASQSAYKEAAAVIAKQKEQLDAIMEENKSLTEQLTAASTRLSNLNEDDYARTDLFKQMRIQHEDVIRRVNHLEATNIQLREEAEKLHAERTSYRKEVEDEAEVLNGELESQVQRTDADLTRVRSARDELNAELAMRKATQDQDHTALQHIKELAGAKEERIVALELEIERLKARVEERTCELTPRPEVDVMDLEQLRNKYETMQQEFDSINKELPALQSAYKRVQALTTKKVMDFASLEERVHILAAEKSKADQKYFAARKDSDVRITEVKNLKMQNSKSSDIIAQLKDVETANRTLLTNLEKQLSDTKHSNMRIVAENKKHDATAREAMSKAQSMKKQVEELTELLKTKDSNNYATKQRIQAVELQIEQLRVKCEQAQKDRNTWKQKSLSNQSGEEEMLRVSRRHVTCYISTDNCRLSRFAPSVGNTSRTQF